MWRGESRPLKKMSQPCPQGSHGDLMEQPLRTSSTSGDSTLRCPFQGGTCRQRQMRVTGLQAEMLP